MIDTQTNNGYVAVIFILFKLSLVAEVGHVTNTNLTLLRYTPELR